MVRYEKEWSDISHVVNRAGRNIRGCEINDVIIQNFKPLWVRYAKELSDLSHLHTIPRIGTDILMAIGLVVVIQNFVVSNDIYPL